MIFFYLAGAVVLVAVVWLVQGVRRIGAVSDGKLIGDRPGTALLLIDLQSVFWEHGPYSQTSKSAAAAVILCEIQTARTRGVPIVAVRQEWSIPSTKVIAQMMMKGQAVEGTAGTELAAPFAELADYVVVKRVQDAFETGELDALLAKLKIGKLRIAGLDLNYCVQKTALAAKNRGYDVAVIKDGTLSAAPTQRAERLMASRGVALQ
ncbi:cysteine hydrolase [Aliiroseovarius sp. Z3]|uniref:cysteine hydrolase family protein n=1 Tax=Aliiroseovarius sp. Z3 TaxID=2811402 RepID=UPI0023B2292B|nr:cysteine hydrolase [Aliiroseovarius sp. Z3]MDE9451695.1 cysteine hydrolase [Aliiroseovarius sp. Z3]